MAGVFIILILLLLCLITTGVLSYFVYKYKKDSNTLSQSLDTCNSDLNLKITNLNALKNAGNYETKQVSGNNGTANCSSYCNVDWSGELKRLGWRGGVAVKAVKTGTSTEVGLDQLNIGGGLNCTCLRTDNYPFKQHTP